LADADLGAVEVGTPRPTPKAADDDGGDDDTKLTSKLKKIDQKMKSQKLNQIGNLKPSQAAKLKASFAAMLAAGDGVGGGDGDGGDGDLSGGGDLSGDGDLSNPLAALAQDLKPGQHKEKEHIELDMGNGDVVDPADPQADLAVQLDPGLIDNDATKVVAGGDEVGSIAVSKVMRHAEESGGG
jgi:hypothetical protein